MLLHRSFGKLAFATIRDNTGRIQLLAEASTLDPATMAAFADLDLGDWVGASGVIVTTKKGELSVRISSLTPLAKALRPLPDKWHGMVDVEQRSRQRYVDLIVNEDAQRVARARTAVVAELRSQFNQRGYIEVETPVLLAEATGALARPFVTHHQALDLDMKLRISLELYLKRLVVGGLERVFEIGRIFRNEGVDGTHNPEFTMLESYEALADYSDIMRLVEEVVTAAAIVVNGTTSVHLQRPGPGPDASLPTGPFHGPGFRSGGRDRVVRHARSSRSVTLPGRTGSNRRPIGDTADRRRDLRGDG